VLVNEPFVRYGEEREMNDLDVTIAPEHAKHAVKALMDLGYVEGVAKIVGGRPTIRGESPLLKIVYRFAPDHLPHFSKIRSDGEGGRATTVDVSLSMTWANGGGSVPVSSYLDGRRLGVDGKSVRVLALDIQFMWIALHCFRHGWLMNLKDFVRDVTLSRFQDILLYWSGCDREDILTPRFRSLLDSPSVRLPVLWTCHFVDELFGSTIVDELGYGRPAHEFIYSGSFDNARTTTPWHGSMWGRLEASDRSKLFDMNQRTPFSLFAEAAGN